MSLTVIPINQTHLTFAYHKYRKALTNSDKFEQYVTANSDNEEKARLEILQTVVLKGFALEHKMEIEWINLQYQHKRNSKNRYIRLDGNDIFMKFCRCRFSVDDRSVMYISKEKVDQLLAQGIKYIGFCWCQGLESMNFGIIDVEDIPLVGILRHENDIRSKKNGTVFTRDTYLISSTVMNPLESIIEVN